MWVLDGRFCGGFLKRSERPKCTDQLARTPPDHRLGECLARMPQTVLHPVTRCIFSIPDSSAASLEKSWTRDALADAHACVDARIHTAPQHLQSCLFQIRLYTERQLHPSVAAAPPIQRTSESQELPLPALPQPSLPLRADAHDNWPALPSVAYSTSPSSKSPCKLCTAPQHGRAFSQPRALRLRTLATHIRATPP